MKKTGHNSGAGGRFVTSEEAELWGEATRSLERVKAKARVASAPAVTAAEPVKQAQKALPDPRKPAPSAKQAVLATPATEGPPPLAAFDRRQARRIASGKAEIEARIDLHGLRQAEAHARLRAFLFAAHAKGVRMVLVITGKGGPQESPDHLGAALGERQRGVLKRSVPLWLAEPDLRGVVLSHTSAGVRHGGSGAIYVQLRKPPRSD